MSKRSSTVKLSTAFLALAATVGASALAGCSTGPDDRAYCGDDDRQVLAAEECEDDDTVGVIYVGPYVGDGDGRRYKVGDRLPTTSGERKVQANDGTGRTRVGLPARGGFGGNGAAVNGSSGG
ncbi:hypothetical protein [Micromonospora sp. NPDC047730]|uniref:hypothetical protein n=1 Tax=Micromonospora sp. NPDC047730 TaxID=3364253 RepID=UPI0037153965